MTVLDAMPSALLTALDAAPIWFGAPDRHDEAIRQLNDVRDTALVAAPLVRQGFRCVTQLLYLEHPLSRLPAIPPAAPTFEQIAVENEVTFRQTLALSYEGTLDCPELNGVRTIDEILAGYRAAVTGKLAGWWLLRIQREPAGVLILTELAEDAAWDLSYIGVVPEQRRRGIGPDPADRVRTGRGDRNPGRAEAVS